MTVAIQRASETARSLERSPFNAQAELLRTVQSDQPRKQRLDQLARTVCQMADAVAVFCFGYAPHGHASSDPTPHGHVANEQPASGQLVAHSQHIPAPLDILDGDVKETLETCVNAVQQTSAVHIAAFTTTEDFVAVAVPVLHAAEQLTAIVTIAAPVNAAKCQLIGEMASCCLAMQGTTNAVTQANGRLEAFAAVLDLGDQVRAAGDPDDAYSLLANQTQAWLGASRVSLGICRGKGRGCRLRAVSGLAKFDRRGEFARTAEAAFDEARMRDGVTLWPPSGDEDRHATRSHQKVCAESDTAAAFSQPLRCNDQVVGVLTVSLSAVATDSRREHILEFLRLCERQLGGVLQVVRDTNDGILSSAGRSIRQTLAGSAFKIVLIGLLAAAGLLALPMDYKISCDSQLQPVRRRYVAAPFAATLEKSLVSPGDIVAEHDVLARIDGRELRWELDGIRADHQKAAKQRDSAMAERNVAEAQIARLEMDRLEVQEKLLMHRMKHLEIRSPSSGIVVSGDLEKAEGAPLTTGQTLFEIAPLDRMVVEMAIPEDEIAYVEAGQPVFVRLDAWPGEQWRAEVNKIHPRSEIRDEVNVFIAELELENAHDRLRPGMKGEAKITGPRRPLIWNLFHKPWEKFLQLVW